MSGSFKFELTEDNSKKLLKATDEQIEKALIMCGMKIQEYATKASPTDTGRLKGGLTYSTNTANGGSLAPSGANKPDDYTPRGTPEERTLYAGTNVEYASYVELGHTSPSGKKVPAQPYLEPAFRNQLDLFQQIFTDELTGI